MTVQQRQLARHALGLTSNRRDGTARRNHYCIGPGGDGHQDWLDMAATGLAVKRTRDIDGGDDTFHLTLQGAVSALEPSEEIDTEIIRGIARMEAGK